MESLQGQLLIASPRLLDANFWRTVILIAQHDQAGALGVVLNRPAEPTIGEAAPDLSALVDGDELIFVGGPVQPSGVVVVAEFEDPASAAVIAFDDVGLLDSGTGLDDAHDVLRRARAFVGHAGWGPGQLDEEIAREDWFVAPASRDAVFAEDPNHLWNAVLESKGGQFAIIARMPADPSVN